MEGFLAETATVLGVVALAEVADKTMFTMLGLAALYPWRKVLLGIIPACIAVPAIGIAIALTFKTVLSEFWLQIISGTFFLGLVVWSLHEMAEEEDVEKKERWWNRFGPVVISFCAFFIAEMADRTQFVTISMTTAGGDIVADWLGSALGLILANVLALTLVRLLGRNIPKVQLMYGASILFLASSVWMFADAVGVGGIAKWLSVATACLVGCNPLAYRFVAQHLKEIDALILWAIDTVAFWRVTRVV